MSRRFLIAVGAALVLVSASSGAWASHQFSDVPDDHPFHDEISLLADAGISTGFPDGGFHPTDPITRQSEAALLGRSLGRVASVHDGTWLDSASTSTVAQVNFSSPAPALGGTGSLLVTASIQIKVQAPGACPCSVALGVSRNGSTFLSPWQIDLLPTSATQTVTRTGVLPLPSGLDTTVAVTATRTQGTSSISVVADLTTLYVPFEESGAAG
jgi:hypothetical protein